MRFCGKSMHDLVSTLFPLCRSVSSPANYRTLEILKGVCSRLHIGYHPVGERVYDWVVPAAWKLIEAKITTIDGDVVVTTNNNNLHVVNYSQPFRGEVSLEKLKQHLFVDNDNPDAIPYVTSYYSKMWGMCVSKNQLMNEISAHSSLVVDINVEFNFELGMPYGEIFIPGNTKSEILLSTYICHPSMANNELSGPTIAVYLANFLSSFKNYYSYRIIFVTETIGAIAYISKFKDLLVDRVLAGYILTCLGDEGEFSYMQSPDETSLSDQFVNDFFDAEKIPLKKYGFLERGSDERQFNAFPLNLGVGGLMRSKYGEYSQYHNSLDDLSFVTPAGLKKSFDTLVKLIKYIENEPIYVPTIPLEPMLSKRGLFSEISHKNSQSSFLNISNVLAFMNGKRTTNEIANKVGLPIEETESIIQLLLSHDLVVRL